MYNRSPVNSGLHKFNLMKPLQHMNNIEKGRLLTGLFPESLPEILKAIQDGYENLTQNEQSLRHSWNSTLHSFDYWYALAAYTAEIAAQHENDSVAGSYILCEKLFSGSTALYVIDCIAKQAAEMPAAPQHCPYKLAVCLLFDSTLCIDIQP